VNSLSVTRESSSVPKYAQVAARVRAQIADGALLPGGSAPSGAALARVTGYSVLTCRRALRELIKDGVLIPGASQGARPRVPGSLPVPVEQDRAGARFLSASLARRRRAAGLTQPALAALADVSVTTIGHAETGRLWQSRAFWERADKALSANGELLALHDAYRAADIAFPLAAEAEDSGAGTATDVPETITVAASGPVTCVTITWADGAVTTVYPPGSTPARALAGPCPASGPRANPSSSVDDPLEVTSDDR
jgi:Helix-turn-helix domain/Bacterial regulatory proteins, gntR family